MSTTGRHDDRGTTAAIIVPAYNESRRIPPLLPVLAESAREDGYVVVVACNGCTDGTADLVRQFPELNLLEFEWASKARALNEADRFAGDLYPRLYVDADVQTTSSSLRLLVDALRTDEPRAVRPFESYLTDGAPWIVRDWYDARYLVPSMRFWLEHHIEGHHVYGTNRSGRARFDVFPEEGQMMEDAFFDRMFDVAEKVAVDGAFVTVPLPATTRELFRARVRIYQGNWQLTAWLREHRPDRLEVESGMPRSTVKGVARLRELARGGATFPSWRPQIVRSVLVLTTVNRLAKARARRFVKAGRQSAWR